MESNAFIPNWGKLEAFEKRGQYKVLRTSSSCIPELFIAINDRGERCLALFLPQQIQVNLKGTEIENLKLSYVKEEKLLLLQLKDEGFHDLFDELIISLHSAVKKLESPESYSQEFIRTFYKWVDFFDVNRAKGLSMAEIKGLYGELIILIEQLQSCSPSKSATNDVLSAWKGPFDSGKDFVFDDREIEVKTKDESKSIIRISSEFQLEETYDMQLVLTVVSIVMDTVSGKSLYDLLLIVRAIIFRNLGDSSILFRAIMQKGLNLRNVKDYNNSRFRTVRVSHYDCCADAFPKLVKSSLPDAIGNIMYDIRESALKDFLIIEKSYENDSSGIF